MRPTRARREGLNWRIETILETTSTNDLILRRAREDEAEGLVIRAISQTRGKGRRGRSWFSPPGEGLYFSMLLRPNRNAETLSAVTLVAGVGVAEGLREATGCPVMLKWPNDLRARGKKIGGILCEFTSIPGAHPSIVAGVGINLTTREIDFPPELRALASSILLSGGRTPDAENLLSLLLDHVAFWYKKYVSSGFGAVQTRWLHLCDHLGQRTSVRGADEKIDGTTKGIDEAGRLLIERADGSIERIVFGELELP